MVHKANTRNYGKLNQFGSDEAPDWSYTSAEMLKEQSSNEPIREATRNENKRNDK